jgi:hypothetical protein
MAKSAINRHYDKVHYLRMVNNPYYLPREDFSLSYGYNKRKIREFICADDEYFAKRLIEYKRKRLESHWQDNLEDLEYVDVEYERYLEAVIKHEDYCYKHNLDPLENRLSFYEDCDDIYECL